MDPPVNQTQMPCIPLHPLVDLVQCIYIEGRWTPQSIKHRCLAYLYTHWQIQYNAYIQKADGPPSQSSIDALHSTTPTASSRPPVYQAQMPCILLHPLVDLVQCIYIEGKWTPQSVKERCLAYCYNHSQMQYNAYIYRRQMDPQSIRHRCLVYHYTHCQIQYNAYI